MQDNEGVVGVTGQELYYIERAGYFIRRKLFNPIALSRNMHIIYRSKPEIAAKVAIRSIILDRLLASLLGAPVQWTYADFRHVSAEWARLEATYRRDSEDVIEHAAPRHIVWVRMAIDDDSGLIAAPGSHDPASYQPAGRTPESDEEITIRLAPGDVAFLHPNLLVREIPQPYPARAVMARACVAGVPGVGRVM